MNFTEQLWQDIQPIYDAILNHGFVDELMTGRLPSATFQYYIQQDALYLTDFSRALNQLAARAATADDSLQFTQFAQNAILVERGLHETYFALYDIQPETAKMPACFAYTNYLLATTSLQSVAVGAAAVLPCFWIYREVGKYIYRQAIRENPYRSWIDTYAGEAFDLSVTQMLALTDRFAEAASPVEQDRMRDAFRMASRLEWYFWNDAYTRHRWLV
ncbi:thiaminase II [Spirosoma utsteinense]|uniref:Aminopyrimidine aminohydrolase n=1 Tax=Spirosoma utsteinense TaxID=2585773 RepID=A0ABR6W5B8_9BACT|nr:thiaminase II [Spirosoma utsteinense]MBC3786370.1 thiaminase/transcriptional activator TenA [Spirosoma utsteinense]MBC3791419.1 thiaminase/transcriptional activator TenA [Spirosoma utsteinense]